MILDYNMVLLISSQIIPHSNRDLNMIINKQKQVREVNKPVKVLFPFRQIAIRTRVLHRLNPQELMIRQGF